MVGVGGMIKLQSPFRFVSIRARSRERAIPVIVMACGAVGKRGGFANVEQQRARMLARSQVYIFRLCFAGLNHPRTA